MDGRAAYGRTFWSNAFFSGRATGVFRRCVCVCFFFVFRTFSPSPATVRSPFFTDDAETRFFLFSWPRRRRDRRQAARLRIVHVEPEELQLGHAVHPAGAAVVPGQRVPAVRGRRADGHGDGRRRRPFQAGVQQRKSRVHAHRVLGDGTPQDVRRRRRRRRHRHRLGRRRLGLRRGRQGTVVGQHRVAHVRVGTQQRFVQPVGPETLRHK